MLLKNYLFFQRKPPKSWFSWKSLSIVNIVNCAAPGPADCLIVHFIIMLIRINGCDGQEEWCILEFQGDLVGTVEPTVEIGSISVEVMDHTYLTEQ